MDKLKKINWKAVLFAVGVTLLVVWLLAPRLKPLAQKIPLIGGYIV